MIRPCLDVMTQFKNRKSHKIVRENKEAFPKCCFGLSFGHDTCDQMRLRAGHNSTDHG